MSCALIIVILLLVIIVWGIYIARDCKRNTSVQKKDPDCYWGKLLNVIFDNLKRDILPFIIITVFITGIVGLCIWSAQRISPQYPYWLMLEKFFKDHAVVSSVVGTFIGLVLIFLILRPSVYIHNATMYKHPKKNQWHLKVKVTNLGFFELHDVKAKMQWYVESNLNLSSTSTMELRNPEILRLSGFHKGDKKRAYGWHAIEPYSGWNDKYTHVRIQITATHSLSGIQRVYEKYFTREEIEEQVMSGFPMPEISENSCNSYMDEISNIVEEYQKSNHK